MKKLYFFKKLLLLATVLFGMKMVAQPCYSPSSYGSANITSFVGVMTNINTCTYGGEYNTLTVGVSGVFTFSASGGTGNYLTISTGVSSGSLAAGLPPLTLTLTAGTYYLHVATSNTCGTESLCHTTSYSNTAIAGSPTITSQPSNLSLCSGSNGSFIVAATGGTSYQWESSTGGPFTALTNVAPYSGVTTPTLNITGATNGMNNTQFRCVVTNGTGNVASNAVVLTVLAGASLPLIEDFNASTTFPTLWNVNASNPWYVYTNHGTAGSNGMSRNLYSTTQILAQAQTPNVGVVTNSTTLSFDYRIMEYSGYPGAATPTASIANDSLNIYISTNCGATFSLLGSINASNHTVTTSFTSKSYNLAPYAGNSVIIRFRANKDASTSSDYYVDVDNINISNVVPIDAGVTAFVTPIAGRPCYNNNEQVVVTVKNWGTANISNVPVKVNVTGPVNSLITTTLAGPVLPGATANVTVGTVNMTAGGVYNFKCYTDLATDPTKGNDTLLPVIQRTVSALGTTPLPYFEDFNALTAIPATWINNPSANWFVGANHGTSASNGMYRNLYGSFAIRAEADMLKLGAVTPSTTLKFDYRYVDYSGFPNSAATQTSAIVGDSLNIYVSTNCGLSYSLLGSINASNHVSSTAFVSKTYPMAAYAGSDVIIKFLATKVPANTADYYVDVDNINLYNASAVDAGVSALAAPVTNTCYTTSTPVSVVLNNFGTGAISNIPVTVTVALGASVQTISTTYTPSIPVGGSVTVLVGNVNMTNPGNYTFTSVSGIAGDGNSSNDQNLTVINTPVIAAISGQTVACLGGSVTLNATGTATAYLWSNGATTNSVSVAPATNTVYSVVGTSSLGCTFTATQAVTVTNPTISANGALACGSGTLTGTLTATSFGTVNWYASPSSTTSLGTGNSFPVSAASTTTYYAEASSVSVNQIGLATNTTVAGGGQQTSTNYNTFDVFSTCIIQDVTVYAGAAGNVVFELRDNIGNLITTTSVPVTNTVSGTVIPLNFTVTPGTGYRLGQGAGSVSMYRTSASSNLYPFSIPGVMDMTGSAAGNTFYYFGYNWTVVSPGCTSPRVPAVFTVSPSGAVAIAASQTLICSGSTATLTASGASTYTWNTGAQTSAIVVSPSVTTSYTVNASGSCGGSATTTLTVNPSPNLVVSPIYTLCASTTTVPATATLTASGANTYFWTPGNLTTPTIVVTPTTTTAYNVVGTGTNGCASTGTTGVLVIVCTGLQNNTVVAENVQIMPNPTNGIINVVLTSKSDNMYFEVLDVTGKVVLRETLTQYNTIVDATSLANGLYAYRIMSADKALKQGKLVKQ